VRLERGLLVVRGRRDGVEQDAEQRFEVVAVLRNSAVGGLGEGGDSVAGAGVHDREVDLFIVGVQIEEELVGVVHDLLDPGVGSVHLVDDQDDRHPCPEGLAKHEPGLGQRALAGIHQEHDPVDHGEAALHLTAEVGVPRGVDDVDRHRVGAVGRHVPHAGVLRENSDALLAFEIHRVHHPLGHLAPGAVGASLPQHGVNQGGLAVVDVGDDGDVAEVGAKLHASILPPAPIRGGVGVIPGHPRGIPDLDRNACKLRSAAGKLAFVTRGTGV